jgi:hypothetical protein
MMAKLIQICPECHGRKMVQYDTYKRDGIVLPRYQCVNCKHLTIYPLLMMVAERKGSARCSKVGELTDLEINMKVSGTQPSPDFEEYRIRMIRQIEPLIRFKERQRMEYEQSKGK